MVLNRQLNSPDTCGCIFEEYWDSENIQAPHTLKEFVYRCPEHRDNEDEVATYQQIVKENATKNLVLKHVVENDTLPPSMIDVSEYVDFKTRKKHTTKSLHNRVVYNYYFDDDRKFNFSFEGLNKNGEVINLTNEDKTSMNNILHKHLGPGKHQIFDILHQDLHPHYNRALNNRMRNKDSQEAEHRFRVKLENERKMSEKKKKLASFFTK